MSAASASAAAAVGETGVTIVTLEAPKLEMGHMNKAGVSRFLEQFKEYRARVEAVTGVRPMELVDLLPKAVVDLWIARKKIADKKDGTIMAELKKMSEDTTKTTQRTVEEVFAGVTSKQLYHPDFCAEARVIAFAAEVHRLITEFQLEKQLENDNVKKRLQMRLAEMVPIPRAAERIRRRIILNSDKAFTDNEWDALLFEMFVQSEEFEAAKPLKNESRSESKAENKTEIKKESKYGSKYEASSKDRKELRTTILTRQGEVLECNICRGNHFASQCTDAKAKSIVNASGDNGQRRYNLRLTDQWKKAGAKSAEQKIEGTKTSKVQTKSCDNNEQKTSSAMVPALIGNEHVMVLVDSGSEVNLMSESVFKRSGCGEYWRTQGKKDKVFQADGVTELKVKGHAEVEFSFASGEINLAMTIVESEKDILIISDHVLKDLGIDVGALFLDKVQQRNSSGLVRSVSAEGADEGNENSMEEVLIQSQETEQEDIPTIEVLFPAVKDMEQADKTLVEEFYSRLPTLVYSGPGPAIGPDLDVEIKPGAKPFHARSRGFPYQARMWLETTRNEYIEKQWIEEINGVSKWASVMFPVRKPDGSYRAVCDYTQVNRSIIATTCPMPLLGTDNDRIRNCEWWGKIDCLKGYHQVKVSEQAGDVLALLIGERVFRAKRLFPGVHLATAHFQKLMQSVILSELTEAQRRECIFPVAAKVEDEAHLKVWLDDTRISGQTLQEYLGRLERLLIRVRDHHIRLNMKKTILLDHSIVFCGQRFSKSGIIFDPDRTKSLLNIPVPKSTEDLSFFINSINWNREGIPRFSELASPLRTLLEQVFHVAGGRSKRDIRKVNLESLWKDEHLRAFQMLKNCLAREIERDYPRPEWQIFLFTDASQHHWSGVLMQSPRQNCQQQGESMATSDTDSGTRELKNREFRVLAFASGTFKGSEERWDTQSKEIYAVLCSLSRFRYMVYGEITLVFDHRNFSFILGNSEPSMKRVTQNRVLRMREAINQFPHRLLWLPGEQLPWVDYLTRGGSSMENGPQALMGGVASDSIVRVSSKGLHPEATENASLVNAVSFIGSVVSPEYVWVDIDSSEFIEVCKGTQLEGEAEGMQRDTMGRIIAKNGAYFIPTQEMRIRTLIAAHSTLSGHQNHEMMVKEIEAQFYWKGLRADARKFQQDRLHCLAFSDGDKQARPYGSLLIGERPGEVLQVDHATMHVASKQHKHLLVIVDTLTNYTVIYPCESTGGKEAAQHLVHFCSLHCVPQWVISDSGTGFVGEIVARLCDSLKIQRHLVATYIHQGSGKVERAIRWILHIFRMTLSELRIPPENWVEIVPLVQTCINSAPRESLGGMSSIEVFSGLPPTRPLSMMARANVPAITEAQIKDFDEKMNEVVQECIKRRESEQKEAIERVSKKRQEKRMANEKMNKNAKPLTVEYGDYVLVASKSNSGKLEARWKGPYRVVSIPSTYIVEAEHMLDGKREMVHVSRAIKYDNRLLNVEALLREQSGYFNAGFRIEEIMSHKREKGWLLLVKWLGFDHSDDTWEPAETIREADPEAVQKYSERTSDAKLKKFLAVQEA